LLLDLSSAIIFGSERRGTHDHILQPHDFVNSEYTLLASTFKKLALKQNCQ
jgi:hypothetical protein